MIVNVMPQFGASLTDDSGGVIYDCNKFIIQAFDCLGCLREDHQQSFMSMVPVYRLDIYSIFKQAKGLYYKTFYRRHLRIFVIS